jgi:lipopolysaccharide export LptBFGC system permease protein LptF
LDLLGLEEAPKYCPICGAELSEADLRQGKCPTCGQKPPDTAAEERIAERRSLRIAGTLSLVGGIVALLLVLVVACDAIAVAVIVVRWLGDVIDVIKIKGEYVSPETIVQQYANRVPANLEFLLIPAALCAVFSVLAGIVGLARSDRKAVAAAGFVLGIVAGLLTLVVFYLLATMGWAVAAAANVD